MELGGLDQRFVPMAKWPQSVECGMWLVVAHRKRPAVRLLLVWDESEVVGTEKQLNQR